jgi:hypothetical protein
MKDKLKISPITIGIVLISGFCAAYLQIHGVEESMLMSESKMLEASIQEGAHLPDVTFVKEILKSIFNIVRA